jgi:hypothetical protein
MTIAVAPSEWGPNLDAFAVRNLRVTQPPAHGDGPADLAALERLLPPRSRLRLIAPRVTASADLVIVDRSPRKSQWLERTRPLAPSSPAFPGFLS